MKAPCSLARYIAARKVKHVWLFFRDIFESNEGHFTLGNFIENKNIYPIFFTGVYLQIIIGFNLVGMFGQIKIFFWGESSEV